ncbi:hypothetical protein HC891_14180 [Candidatus Gracilibacteria bacterium]|nr:hypothetical protein [Candidatus Gracilibacteria bacterium]
MAFSEAQLLGQGLQGIAENLNRARDSLTRTLRLLRESPTVFLPSHDPDALARLASGAVVAPATPRP